MENRIALVFANYLMHQSESSVSNVCTVITYKGSKQTTELANPKPMPVSTYYLAHRPLADLVCSLEAHGSSYKKGHLESIPGVQGACNLVATKQQAYAVL